MKILLLFSLSACDGAEDACAPFCRAASDAQAACLAASDLDWEALGYADQDDWLESCQTWAWEQRQLARDAGVSAGAVDAACQAQEGAMEGGGCSEIQSFDWNDPVWESAP